MSEPKVFDIAVVFSITAYTEIEALAHINTWFNDMVATKQFKELPECDITIQKIKEETNAV